MKLKITGIALIFAVVAPLSLASAVTEVDQGAASLNGYTTSASNSLPALDSSHRALQQEQREMKEPAGGLSASWWALFILVVGVGLLFSVRVNNRHHKPTLQ